MMERNKTVFLIRHGESYHNRDGNQLSGITDVEMSPEGIRQCHELARYIECLNIQKVYSSPLNRARKTADIIFPDHEIQIEPGFIEFNYGDYEGIVAAKLIDDPIIQQWNQAPGNLTFPGGDNTADFAERTFTIFKEICHTTKEETLACVTHRTSTRLLISKILGLSLDWFRSIPCSNCGISEIHVNKNGELRLATLNITSKYFYSDAP